MFCKVCNQDHSDKNMRWCDRSNAEIENDYLKAENELLKTDSLIDFQEYKRATNDLIKEIKLKLEYEQLLQWCKAKMNDYVIGLEAENARYREALEFYACSDSWNHTIKDFNGFEEYTSITDDDLGAKAREALKGGE